MKCCKPDPEERLSVSEVQELLENMEIRDDRSEAQSFTGSKFGNLRLRPGINWDGAERLFSQIQVRRLTIRNNQRLDIILLGRAPANSVVETDPESHQGSGKHSREV
jgi:hypothetical protein